MLRCETTAVRVVFAEGFRSYGLADDILGAMWGMLQRPSRWTPKSKQVSDAESLHDALKGTDLVTKRYVLTISWIALTSVFLCTDFYMRLLVRIYLSI